MTPSLMLSAVPDIDEIHIEIYFVPPKPEGPPRDVIVKLYFFRVKGVITRYAREHPDLEIDGFKLQVFSDIFQSTMQKERLFKPLLHP